LSLRHESAVAALVTVYSLLLAGVLGVVWSHLAPRVDIIRAANGSEVASKALLGDDLWFALLGAAAGILSVALLLIAARDAGRGPGAVVGLALGGFVGSLIAAQLGHHIQRPHLLADLHAGAPTITALQVTTVMHYFDFLVRAKAVLLAWSLAALVLHAATLVGRAVRLGPEQ
jgi:hypothetical protein